MKYFWNCDPITLQLAATTAWTSLNSHSLTVSSCKAHGSAPEPEDCRVRASPYEQEILCPSCQSNKHRLRTRTVNPPELELYMPQTWPPPLEMVVTVVVSMFLIKMSEGLLSTWKIWHQGSHQIHNLLSPRELQPAGYSK